MDSLSASYRRLILPETDFEKTSVEFVNESASQETLNTSTRTGARLQSLKLLYKLGFIFFSIVAVVSLAVVIVYFTVLTKAASEETPPHEKSHMSQREETSYELGDELHIFTRIRWGGRPILPGWENRTLVHPAKLVIIGQTGTRQCMTIEACSTQLQMIQSDHVDRNNYLDIGYNFLVGGEGNIYQALGWDIRNYVRNNSIFISFMGNYVYDHVIDLQRMGVQALLDRGVELGKLDEDYLLVGHNQVTNTARPETRLQEEIKLWPHYYNGTFI